MLGEGLQTPMLGEGLQTPPRFVSAMNLAECACIIAFGASAQSHCGSVHGRAVMQLEG